MTNNHKLLGVACMLSIVFVSACTASNNARQTSGRSWKVADKYIVAYDTVYAENDVDTPPAPIGGMKAVYQNLEYPSEARKNRIEGTVHVRVVVSPESLATNPVIIRPVHPTLNKASVRAILKSRFKPGRHNGRAVPTQMTMPVSFELL
ncbi:energy transducer TonB [Salisaeta longa]|uniref:energy transducer TonB n=1 Tax=Salisaeta longa TaxID=503170 RepID=UPI0003B653F5|nr:energy transducer TonB [Salisaeta longa]